MIDENCGYCVKGEPLAKFGIYVCDLSVSMLVLFKEQSHPGRCIVAYKNHVSEMTELTDEKEMLSLLTLRGLRKRFTPLFIRTK